MLLRTVVYGLMAHLLLGWAFFFFMPSSATPVKKPPVPVTIVLKEKEAKLADRPRKDSGGQGTRAASASPAPSRVPFRDQTPPPKSSAATAYSELLPKARDGQLALPEGPTAGNGSLMPGQRFKEGSSGTVKQKLMVDASILSGALDVPLHARRITTGAAAFLRIVRLDGRRLKIVDLRGDPMLRAAIFEHLHEPRVITLMLELMDALNETSLPITLQSLGTSPGRLQDETDFTWIGRRLVIRKAAPPESRAPFGAITLPDEDAKKAVIRDRLEFERFQSSPAYRSAIQNYELPAGS